MDGEPFLDGIEGSSAYKYDARGLDELDAKVSSSIADYQVAGTQSLPRLRHGSQPPRPDRRAI
jgi:hypothetical protein